MIIANFELKEQKITVIIRIATSNNNSIKKMTSTSNIVFFFVTDTVIVCECGCVCNCFGTDNKRIDTYKMYTTIIIYR